MSTGRGISRAPKRPAKPRLVLTVGHSTRSIEEFIHLLKCHDVSQIVDVRTIPRSRHNPQFNSEALARSLRDSGIEYEHLPGLGGLRHTTKASVNTGWRNTSFRGYADYMQKQEFDKALQEFLRIAKGTRSALMCAEAVPWRCHRSLISDALIVRGVPVEHILSPGSRQVHKLTPFAKVQGHRITYPAESSIGAGKSPAGIPEKEQQLLLE